MKNNRCIISGVDVSDLPFGYDEQSPDCQNIKMSMLNTVNELHKNGVDEFYTDCSFGFPLWGAEIVAGLMMYNDIRLYIVYPYEEQALKYTPNWQDRFYKMHELCTDVIPMFMDRDTHFNFAELVAEAADFMVNDCGKLLFCGDGTDSYIYEKAIERELQIINLEIARGK